MFTNQRKTIIFILFLLGTLLYANTLSHGYVLDDFSVIKDNFVVKRGSEGISTIWKTHYRHGYGYTQANLFRPIPLTLFAIQWEIAPDQPAFAHFFNVLLYSLLGVLIFIFLDKLLGREKLILSFLASALFIAHPIHTEVVANIKSIDDILALGFSLISLLFLFSYLESKQKKWLLASLLSFTLAFFSKESTVTFLGIIPLSLILFRSHKITEALKLTSWYLIPFAIYMAVRANVLGSISGDKTIAKLDNLLMAAPDELSRLATAIKILGLYLWKLIFPHPLMNDYSLNQIEIVNFSSPWVWLSILVHGLLIYVMISQWKKTKLIAYSIGFYFITIFLYSNLFITIGTSFGERLLFMPSLGFCLLLAYLIHLPFKKKINSAQLFKSAIAPMAITAVLISIYSFKTIDRNKAWKDNFTLYETDVANCDQSARCHYYYGLGLMKEKAILTNDPKEKQQLLTQSLAEFNKAIEILPTYGEAWGQIGLVYYRLEDFKKAETFYLKALQFSPKDATVLSNLGSMYFQQQRYQEAKTIYERALQANPNHIDALANYASTLGTLGDFNSAITYFKRAIALKPTEPNYYQMVGVTYQNLGNQQQASVYLQKAKQLRGQ